MPLAFGQLVDLGFSFTPTMAVTASAFDKMGLDIRSFREPLKRSIQRVIAPSIGQNFVSNGRPETWAPYAANTIQTKANDPQNQYGPEDMLRRSGLLWRTMQQYNIWSVSTVEAAILDLPEKIWYGALHQAGYTARGTAVPARQFALFQERDMDAIQEVFANWLEERALAAGVVTGWA